MALSTDAILENRYRIDRLIAQGGMGAIYQGFDIKLQTSVAIKENFFQTPESLRQFEREALILARLRHPGLPRVSDHFMYQGHQYLVMDFIEGQDLWQIVKVQGRPLEETQAVGYMKQVAEAVAYLHQQQPPIIHRDIKPQNIKITPQGQAVLVDFGIAKMAEVGERTTTGAQGVTPGFSPPEQYSGMGTTPQSDIYALGATLYALLTGQRPPDSISLLAGGVKFAPPRNLNPQLSERVSQAISHAMQPRAEQRPVSVSVWLPELTGEGLTAFHEGATMMADEPTNLSPQGRPEHPTITHPLNSESVPPRRVNTIPPTEANPVPIYRPTIPVGTTDKPSTQTIPATPTPPETASSSSAWRIVLIIISLLCALVFGVTCLLSAMSAGNENDISQTELAATKIALGQTATAEIMATQTEMALANKATSTVDTTATEQTDALATALAEQTALFQPTETETPTETPIPTEVSTVEPTATSNQIDDIGGLPQIPANIPVLDDASQIETAGNNIKYVTNKGLQEASDFYSEELAQAGWIVDPEEFTVEAENIKIGYSRGEEYLVITVTQQPDYVQVIAEYDDD